MAVGQRLSILIIIPGGLMPQRILDACWLFFYRRRKRFRGWLIKHIWRKLSTRGVVTYYALRAIWGPEWEKADRVVREIATTPSSRNFKWWGEIARLELSNPRQGENVWRNFSARIQMNDPRPNRTDVALLTELAYLGLKKRGR